MPIDLLEEFFTEEPTTVEESSKHIFDSADLIEEATKTLLKFQRKELQHGSNS